MIPLRSVLQNGDQVEILTSKGQTPSPTWERYVVTGKARARIRRFIRSQEREQYAQLGRSILKRAFKEEGYDFTEKSAADVLTRFKQPTADDLMAAVGAGHITGRAVLEAVVPGVKDRAATDKVVPLAKARQAVNPDEHAVSIEGLIPGMAMHFAGCCHPLPGDRIVGIVTSGKGVTIHTIDCPELETFTDQAERWIDLSWSSDRDETEGYVGRVTLTVVNAPGSLGELSTVIARNDGNISNLRITNRSTDFFDMLIDIEVRDVKHLTNIIAALRASNSINAVERARG
jgi:guanosine-3',5'-bis(diphosphate) 3'-pyrophosphohydrolase